MDTTSENANKVKDIEDIQHVCVTPDIPNSQYSNLIHYLTHGI
jgi:hypothetical protein